MEKQYITQYERDKDGKKGREGSGCKKYCRELVLKQKTGDYWYNREHYVSPV